MPERRIPVVVLAGFLGSGKTTLLNHLLRHSRGTRIGAVVNDFGSIEIDAMAVAGQVDAMVSLGDGCLCCAVDTSDMDDVLERLARPSVGMDVIVVEASGLAEPETLIRMILAADSPHTVYGGLVEVVDAAEYDGVRQRHPELERHLRAADLVVLNKADRVAPQALDRLEAELAALRPSMPLVRAAYGRIGPELLFDPARRERPAVEQLSFEELLREQDDADAEAAQAAEDAGGGAHAGHLHAAYESVEFTAARPLHPRRLLDFLDDRPAGLYRVKGFVDFGAADPARRYSVHAVGRFLRFAPGDRPPGEERLTQLVLIGSGIDGDAVRARLAACVAEEHEEPDARALWGVLRYVDHDDDHDTAHDTDHDGDNFGDNSGDDPAGDGAEAEAEADPGADPVACPPSYAGAECGGGVEEFRPADLP